MFSTERRRVSIDAVHVRRQGPLEWKRICNSCRQKKEDEKKRQGNGRLREKARKMVERHRVIFCKWVGREITRDEMESELLYDLDDIVHDMEHALKNGCHWCRDPYSRMGHGPADISLDIFDPRKHRADRTAPVYRHDAGLCCKSCNSKKQDLTPDQWKQVCISFRRRVTFQTELSLRPLEERHVRLSFLDAIGLGSAAESVA